MLHPAGFRLKPLAHRGGTQENYQETVRMYPYVHVHKQHRTRNNLNIQPADTCHLRHLRWFWRQKNKQKNSQIRNYAAIKQHGKLSLSHWVFQLALKMHFFFHSCILYVKNVTDFALDSGALYKKKTQQNRLLNETQLLWAQLEPDIYIQKKI